MKCEICKKRIKPEEGIITQYTIEIDSSDNKWHMKETKEQIKKMCCTKCWQEQEEKKFRWKEIT